MEYGNVELLKGFGTSRRLKQTGCLVSATTVCFAMSVSRVLISGEWKFMFLNWNLFLAAAPWLLSALMATKPELLKWRFVFSVLMFIWLMFFPNTLYILTDLFHLRGDPVMPAWFDLILVLSFAWTGLLFGFFSLMDIEKVMQTRMPARFVPMASVALLFIGSFGVYLGRYLRWNSWDVIRNPVGLTMDVAERILVPWDHPRTWGMTLLLGMFLNLMFWSLKIIKV